MNLSPDQLAAIKHRGTHLQIIACAGSGKTEVMARRVTALIEEGVVPADRGARTAACGKGVSLEHFASRVNRSQSRCPSSRRPY
jgi:hypothetical protein